LVLNFLLDRVRSSAKPKANFYQALGILHDPSALSVLRSEYEMESREIKKLGLAADRSLLVDFFRCCAVLHSLGSQGAYLKEIEKYVTDPNADVKQSAQRILREATTDRPSLP
jgi:hypothetical protein